MTSDIEKGIEYFQKAQVLMETDDDASLEKAIFLLHRGMESCLVSITETIKRIPQNDRPIIRDEVKHNLKIRRIVMIQKLVAEGLNRNQIANRLELSATRVGQLINEINSVKDDPKFIELMNK